MDLSDLKTITSRGEDSRHQFKEDIRNGDSLAAEMVAFSNSHGGFIFIGVSNHGELVGLSSSDVDRINQLISNSASQHVKSPITIHTENISVAADRVVIVLTIPEGIDKPYFDNQGVIWLKSGADKRRIHSKEELRRLFQEVDLVHADEVPTRAPIEAIDSKKLQDFLADVYKEELPDSNEERLKLLENMNLSTSSQLNLAGLLLFGKKPQLYKPEFIVKAVTFAGNDIADSYLDSEDFEGSLPSIFQGALSFIMRNLRKIQKKKSVNTTGEPEIPQIVFEELLVNALIHRDYFISAPVRLFIFEDRVEIINPGNLPDHLTIEKIRAGNSIQRNPILASFAAKGLLPYRGLGTGIRRALQDWPQIKFINDQDGCLFTSRVERVKIQNAPITPSSPKNAPINAPITPSSPKNAPINAPITSLQQQILEILKDDPKVSYELLESKLGKERTTIMRNIQKMKDMGILRRSGSNKTGYWEIL
ncbi:MAG: putative DNA binding domain-containing protein [Chlamydiae bacterium]|nr:putative DNA binding domain-containing protein [Chlamydiota bacterium]